MKKIYYIYIANVFLGFHYALITYLHSSFLSKFTDTKTIGFLYMLGAGLSLILLFSLPKILRRVEAKTLTAGIIIAEFLAVFMISQATHALTAEIFFVIQQMVGVSILYCLDLFLEATEPSEKNTGRSRAFFLTAMNIPWVLSLGIVSFLVKDTLFSSIYMLSAMMLIPILFILVINFTEHIQKDRHISLKGILNFLKKDKDVLRILGSNLILQFFYATMTIYLPLLLFQTIGFDWKEIGLILLIMILPFVIFEIPVGRIIDKRTGETEFLFIGFIIMSISCLTIALIGERTLWLWALMLFMSRIGASLVEISNESYFFKKVTEKNSSIISLFRMTPASAYILAPIVGVGLLKFSSYNTVFAMLGLVCVLGIALIPKTDTR